MSGGVSVDVLAALVDTLNAHDLDRILAFSTDDAVLQMPRGPASFGRRFEGKAAVRDGLASRLAGLPDVHYGEAEHFTCGDTGISKWRLTGTTLAGERVAVRGCDFYAFRDGEVIKKDSYWKIIEPWA